MEERSIIARELHDSLAQVLSFLQIQLTLLKHNLKKEDEESKEKSIAIIGEFEQALSDGYSQLRIIGDFPFNGTRGEFTGCLGASYRKFTFANENANDGGLRLPSQSLNPTRIGARSANCA